MSDQLPDGVWSPEDLSELIADLQRYAQWLSAYQIKQRVAGRADATAQPTLSAPAITCLEQLRDQQNLNLEAVAALVARLEKLQAEAPKIVFTLAGPPSNGLKKRLRQWCRQVIAPDVLVSFQFNATILGGMVVRFGSHIFDWSFRRQILEKRGSFAEILRHV